MKRSFQFLDRQKRIVPLSLLALLALVLAACQPAVATTQPAPAVVATSTSASVPVTGVTDTPAAMPVDIEPVVNVATDPQLGQILVDGEGMTLYMFTKDEPNKSNCADKCLQAWPPLKSMGSPTAGAGVDASLLGTAPMPDGSLIVTYNKMPLYYFAKDAKPGDVTGQDVNQVWYVVAPDGKPVKAVPSSSTSGQAAQADAGVTVKVAKDAKLGDILVDGEGMTLYMFTKDGPDVSNCSGGCLTAWPPLLVENQAVAGDGVDDSLLGTATLSDGTKIVTYNHMPLYYWAGDTKAGDTTGQDVNKVWYVVSPDGKPVGMAKDGDY